MDKWKTYNRSPDQHIKEKTNFLVYKLWPLLKKVSLDYRINLWRVLVKPLFEMKAGLYFLENKSNKDKVLRCLRKTFKSFTLLCRNVDELMSFQFEERAQEFWESVRIKWKARKEHSPDFSSRIEEEGGTVNVGGRILSPVNYKSFWTWPPHFALCVILHAQRSICWHITFTFLIIKSYWRIFKVFTEDGYRQKLNRRQILLKISDYLRPFVLCLKDHVSNCAWMYIVILYLYFNYSY